MNTRIQMLITTLPILIAIIILPRDGSSAPTASVGLQPTLKGLKAREGVVSVHSSSSFSSSSSDPNNLNSVYSNSPKDTPSPSYPGGGGGGEKAKEMSAEVYTPPHYYYYSDQYYLPSAEEVVADEEVPLEEEANKEGKKTPSSIKKEEEVDVMLPAPLPPFTPELISTNYPTSLLDQVSSLLW